MSIVVSSDLGGDTFVVSRYGVALVLTKAEAIRLYRDLKYAIESVEEDRVISMQIDKLIGEYGREWR